jgi:ribosomal protein S8
MFIVSTSKGILTNVDAIKNNVGGEVILKIS